VVEGRPLGRSVCLLGKRRKRAPRPPPEGEAKGQLGAGWIVVAMVRNQNRDEVSDAVEFPGTAQRQSERMGDARGALTAVQKKKKCFPSAQVAYRGLSRFDGMPVRVIVSNLKNPSVNKKTGDVIQVLYAPDDIFPPVAITSDKNISVCGDCPMRAIKGCYVHGGSPAVWRPWVTTHGMPADLDAVCDAISKRGVPVRLGAWGDPACVPLEVSLRLVEASTAGHTGYTQQWRQYSEFAPLLNASVYTAAERDEAHELGFRTFRVKLPGDPCLPGEILCRNAVRADILCRDCLLCSGSGDGRVDIAIDVHGSQDRIRRFMKMMASRKAGGIQ